MSLRVPSCRERCVSCTLCAQTSARRSLRIVDADFLSKEPQLFPVRAAWILHSPALRTKWRRRITIDLIAPPLFSILPRLTQAFEWERKKRPISYDDKRCLRLLRRVRGEEPIIMSLPAYPARILKISKSHPFTIPTLCAVVLIPTSPGTRSSAVRSPLATPRQKRKEKKKEET